VVYGKVQSRAAHLPILLIGGHRRQAPVKLDDPFFVLLVRKTKAVVELCGHRAAMSSSF
jgi:hypothetical protein